jgi:hypothetical protein
MAAPVSPRSRGPSGRRLGATGGGGGTWAPPPPFFMPVHWGY